MPATSTGVRSAARAGSRRASHSCSARWIALIAARRGEPALRDLTQAAQGLRKTFGPEHEETLIAEFHRALALAYLGHADESQKAFAPVLHHYRVKYRDPVYLPY